VLLDATKVLNDVASEPCANKLLVPPYGSIPTCTDKVELKVLELTIVFFKPVPEESCRVQLLPLGRKP